jgi:hypothetical protein
MISITLSKAHGLGTPEKNFKKLAMAIMNEQVYCTWCSRETNDEKMLILSANKFMYVLFGAICAN